MTKSQYLTEYDRIVKTMQMYVGGSKQGKSELMRPAFHPEASFFGYAGEKLAVGTKFLFDWIDKNDRDHREHCGRSSGSATLVRQAGWRQCPSL